MIKFLFKVPQKWRMALSLCYLGLIAMLSLLPSWDLPDLKLFAFADKMFHGTMYFGLTLLACWTFHAEKRRIRILYILLFCAGWGFLMELSQLEMMQGRAFEWLDELFNTIGALFGALVYLGAAGVYRKKEDLAERGGEGTRGRAGERNSEI